MPLARVAPALVVGLLGAAAIGPRLDSDPDQSPVAGPPAGCATADASAWSPLPGVPFTGTLSVHLPPGAGSLVLIVGDRLPLDLSAETSTGSQVLMRMERLHPGAGTQAPPAYWLDHGNPWAAPRAVARATIDASPYHGRSFTLRLGRRAPRVLARLVAMPPGARAQLCAREPGRRVSFAAANRAAITAGDGDYFGTGWYGVEQIDGERMRWMSAAGAVLVPFDRRGDVTVSVDALLPVERHSAMAPAVLRLTINDAFDAEEVAARPGRHRYEWTIPRRAWVVGTNELLFGVSQATRRPEDNRDVGMALRRLELEIAGDAADRPGS